MERARPQAAGLWRHARRRDNRRHAGHIVANPGDEGPAAGIIFEPAACAVGQAMDVKMVFRALDARGWVINEVIFSMSYACHPGLLPRLSVQPPGKEGPSNSRAAHQTASMSCVLIAQMSPFERDAL